jgi:hypothetical protein
MTKKCYETFHAAEDCPDGPEAHGLGAADDPLDMARCARANFGNLAAGAVGMHPLFRLSVMQLDSAIAGLEILARQPRPEPALRDDNAPPSHGGNEEHARTLEKILRDGIGVIGDVNAKWPWNDDHANAFRAGAAALRALGDLLPYAQHLMDCDAINSYHSDRPDPCTCGLDAIRRAGAK